MEAETQPTEIEKAQKLIANEKNDRAQAFSQELDALCKKYNCSIIQGNVIIQAH